MLYFESFEFGINPFPTRFVFLFVTLRNDSGSNQGIYFYKSETLLYNRQNFHNFILTKSAVKHISKMFSLFPGQALYIQGVFYKGPGFQFLIFCKQRGNQLCI